MRQDEFKQQPTMKYKFKAGVWLSFTFEGSSCIGRTMIFDDVKIIAAVSTDGKLGHIPYESIENPKVINFLNSNNPNDKRINEVTEKDKTKVFNAISILGMHSGLN